MCGGARSLVPPPDRSHPCNHTPPCVALCSFWFSTNGVTDAFWPVPYNDSFTTTHCAAAWNVTPTREWITTAYDLPSFRGASNIVLSNGLYDPWSGASIQTSPAPERDIVVLNISQGAHHLDLFFAHPDDPPSVTAARATEVAYIRKWVEAARVRRAGGSSAGHADGAPPSLR